MARQSTRFRETDLGREARCSKCGDWWPADSEFFYMQHGVPHAYCKACYIAWRARPGYGNKPPHNDHVRAA